ncbi:MAG: hypothetical protein HY810_01535 [Candidatus Omnitrophica bacterium]|nr:hypothetical protein [Candidatus Omnitrophota bacterium]
MRRKIFVQALLEMILIFSFILPGVFAEDDLKRAIAAPVLSNPKVSYQLVEDKLTIGISRINVNIAYDDQTELTINFEQDGKTVKKNYDAKYNIRNLELILPVSLNGGQVKITAQAAAGGVISTESEPLYYDVCLPSAPKLFKDQAIEASPGEKIIIKGENFLPGQDEINKIHIGYGYDIIYGHLVKNTWCGTPVFIKELETGMKVGKAMDIIELEQHIEVRLPNTLFKGSKIPLSVEVLGKKSNEIFIRIK